MSTLDVGSVSIELAEKAMDRILDDSKEFIIKMTIEEFTERMVPLLRDLNDDSLKAWYNRCKGWCNPIQVHERDANGNYAPTFTVPALTGKAAFNVINQKSEQSINTYVEEAARLSKIVPAQADKKLVNALEKRFDINLDDRKASIGAWLYIYKRFDIPLTEDLKRVADVDVPNEPSKAQTSTIDRSTVTYEDF